MTAGKMKALPQHDYVLGQIVVLSGKPEKYKKNSDFSHEMSSSTDVDGGDLGSNQRDGWDACPALGMA